MSAEAEVIDYARHWEQYARLNLKDQATRITIYHERSLYIDIANLPKILFETCILKPLVQVSYIREALNRVYSIPVADQYPNIRFVNMPMKVPLRSVGSARVGTWISIEGIVRKLSDVSPLIKEGYFKCSNGHSHSLPQTDRMVKFPSICDMCGSRKFELIPEKSKTVDSQRFYLQEFPEHLKGGEIPAEIEIEVTDDCCWSVVPGNRVVVSGMLRAYQKKAESRTLNIYLEANSIEQDDQTFSDIEITEEDTEKILSISQRADLRDYIFEQIAPSIYGYHAIKRAVSLCLFGGVSHQRKDGTSKRGDIHILLLGDPSCGKSQLIKSVYSICPRGVLTSGHTSSKAGLTAAAVQDAGGGWLLEAGASVLADRGSLFVDELDKMKLEDRSSLHQVMEQQELSIAKAGFTVTLPTRCSILAAGNPKLSRFDRYQPLFEQVDMPASLLSRFDLIFLMEDVPDEETDRAITEHIAHGEQTVWDRTMLRKYIAYAKRECFPVISQPALTMLQDYYTRIRKMPNANMPMQIGVRQFDALMRLCEASARMRLSGEANEEDAQLAIQSLDECLKKFAYEAPQGQLDIYHDSTRHASKNQSKKDTERAALNLIIELLDRKKKEGSEWVSFPEIVTYVNTHTPSGTPGYSELKITEFTTTLQTEGIILRNQRSNYKIL